MKKPLVQEIALTLEAMLNCEKSGNKDWQSRHFYRLREELRAAMPSGSGFDSGVYLRIDESKPDRLVFQADFHHMNEAGFYDGWSFHQVIITPSLGHDFEIQVRVRDRKQIKEYIAEVFREFLSQPYEAPKSAEQTTEPVCAEL